MYHIGDYVVRKSYGKDILFRINTISSYGIAKLKGISYRVIADAPLTDLELVGGMRFTDQESSVMNKVQDNVSSIIKSRQLQKVQKPVLEKTGKVLHLDGDMFYLNLCLKYYETLGVTAVGEHVMESEQPKKVKQLIELHQPDVLVLTGHDALNKNYKNLDDIREYKNSIYFVDAVNKARSIRPTTDQLVIFAGACQSAFEKILEAGADYAASPKRVLIHALDPVFIVEKIVHCPFHEILPIEKALEYTITSFKGLGGYEIIGTARKGGPVTSIGEDIDKDNEALRNYIGNSMPS